MNNASNTCQSESGLLKVLSTEDKKNENSVVKRISTIVRKKAMFWKEIT